MSKEIIYKSKCDICDKSEEFFHDFMPSGWKYVTVTVASGKGYSSSKWTSDEIIICNQCAPSHVVKKYCPDSFTKIIRFFLPFIGDIK